MINHKIITAVLLSRLFLFKFLILVFTVIISSWSIMYTDAALII